MKFHHAGIATDDATSLVDLFEELFEVAVVHEETFDGMDVTFLDVGESYFEVLEPHGSGPVADYLDRSGAGVHHLALATEDVAEALSRARALGVDPVDEKPRPGAWGHEVAFLHPRSTGGVLVEFVELHEKAN